MRVNIMSRSKGLLDEQESQRNSVRDLLIETNVIPSCPFHSDVMLEGDHFVEDALTLGEEGFAKGDLQEHFDDEGELFIRARGLMFES